MKLAEIKPSQFNELAQDEPNKSFYQTSNWGSFYSSLDYSPYYLGYVDQSNIYSALGLFLVKKDHSLKENTLSALLVFN